jgi:hypothetical protein
MLTGAVHDELEDLIVRSRLESRELRWAGGRRWMVRVGDFLREE